MTDDMIEIEDEREIELSSISAIFPEITLDPLDPFSASIDLPVTPPSPLAVIFLEPSEGPNNTSNNPETQVEPPYLFRHARNDRNEPEPLLETHYLSHLPSLHLRIELPKGYPSTKPPIFDLSTTPQWLSNGVLERLRADGERLWEESGHDQVVFAYIDHLQQGTEDTFGALDGNTTLTIPQDLKIALLDFDINAKRTAFEKETFTCGVCLDPKKGSACHRMLDCGHVFCRQCLQDFYNNAITEGDLASVKCLGPDCAKQRGTAATSRNGKRRKPKTRISASELLLIPLEQEKVRRYVALKRKLELESDKNTIYCPRKWCQGAARSRKHRKTSQLLDDDDSSGEESETEDRASVPKTGYKAWAELLSVCEDCLFAFCSRCYQGWHGEFTLCTPRTNTGELTEEDKASMEYMKLHTTPCPTCSAPAQKTHGCNHMICFKCETHFCYLCSGWLEPTNPYQHYNLANTSCYMRLWELEGGDGDDVGIGYVGGVQAREQVVDEEQVVAPPVIVEIGPEDPADPEPLVDLGQLLEQPVAREGPLVLRIGQLPRPAPPAARRENAPNRPHHRVPVRQQQPDPRPGLNGYYERPAGGRHAQVADHRRRLREDQQVRNARPARNQAFPARRIIDRPANGGAAPRAANPPDIQAEAVADANRRWVEHFVRLAMADEEDLMESGSEEEDDDEDWQIPVR